MLFTIGHSALAIDDFIELLDNAGIHILVDVRAQPHSKRHPQFGRDALRAALEDAGITYHWAGRVFGGLRTPRADTPHLALEESVRGFADHMDTDEFKTGLRQLLNLAADAPVAILCAERLPEHCHRRLICDALLLQGVTAVHLIDRATRREHALSPEARRESGVLVYDRNVPGRLDLH